MKLIPLFLCALLLCGCAGRMGRNTAKYDKIEAVQINQLVYNNLTMTPFDQKIVYLNARCETKRNGNKDCYLFTEIIPPPDFVLQSGESLIINIDDEVFPVAPTNSPTAFNARKRFTTTFYKVSPDILARLANAKEVRVRIKGTTMVIDKRLAEKNISRFKEFISKYSITTNSPAGNIGG